MEVIAAACIGSGLALAALLALPYVKRWQLGRWLRQWGHGRRRRRP